VDVASDICADFLIEAREIVDQLGEQMVALEYAPTDRECLNSVFRGFHTIKGGAGFLDFPAMVTICHAVEDRFDLARNGAMPMDALAFDGAQQALDLLVDMLDCIAAGEPMPDPPQALIDSMRVDAPAPRGAAPVVAATAESDDLDDLDFEALLDSLHGSGGIPGNIPATDAGAAPAPAAAPAPVPAPVAAAPAHAPAPPPRKPAAAPHPEEPTVRVDVRRLDAMVNLVGELLLARNRLKTLRPRLRRQRRRASPPHHRIPKSPRCAWTCAGWTRWSTWSANSCSRATGSRPCAPACATRNSIAPSVHWPAPRPACSRR
jgi:two-component system chemotaxis sensor kinase CheA